jgi:hypothetical protein
MAVIAALGMGLARWHPAPGAASLLATIAFFLLTTPDPDTRARRLRLDARTTGYCYLGGVVGPLLCLVLDPFVFQGGDEDGAILRAYRVKGLRRNQFYKFFQPRRKHGWNTDRTGSLRVAEASIPVFIRESRSVFHPCLIRGETRQDSSCASPKPLQGRT